MSLWHRRDPYAKPWAGRRLSAVDRTTSPGRRPTPAPPERPTPHCNGQHGSTGICEWCDALAATVTQQRALDERLSHIEVYLGIRRDGDDA
jgi:hypothetical protein